MTQAGLAKTVGISASYLNLIEANKRSIAGGLLNRIAGELELDAETLAGKTERRLIDDLREASADPLLQDVRLEDGAAGDLVARYPDWARALLTVYRGYIDRSNAVAALSDRLSRDPFLGEAVHQILTNITAIRSASEILENVDNLPQDRQKRFHKIMSTESAKLADTAQSLTNFFDLSANETRSLTPSEEVDDFIIERGNYFSAIETEAKHLRKDLESHNEMLLGALMAELGQKFGVRFQDVSSASISRKVRPVSATSAISTR